MEDNHVKALMAAIILATMDPIEDDDVCVFDIATQVANDLWDHVVGGLAHDAPVMVPFPDKPKGQAN
jgi:hypothetical protein